MTQAMVRAKRLVFVERKPTYPDDYTLWECNTPVGLYSMWEHDGHWGWDLYSGEDEVVPCTKHPSREVCQLFMQSDFDARWLAMTEVPELVWKEVYGDIDDSVSSVVYGGHAYIRPNGEYYTSPNGPKGKTSVSEAKRILDTHNRNTLLGITEPSGHQPKEQPQCQAK